MSFDPGLAIRGLVLDRQYGNLVKVDRFGYVKRAMHGTQMLSGSEIRTVYGRDVVELRHEDRYEFLNTLFNLSEAAIYQQLVARLDAGTLYSSKRHPVAAVEAGEGEE